MDRWNDGVLISAWIVNSLVAGNEQACDVIMWKNGCGKYAGFEMRKIPAVYIERGGHI